MSTAIEADLVVTVHGQPGVQGSKKRGRAGQIIDDSAGTLPWREAVKHAALAALRTADGSDAPSPIAGPVSVEITFTLRKPTTAPKTRISWPQRKPDIDKLLRSTFDALTDAGAWMDDAQVVDLSSRKVYPGEGIDALHIPGALIRITRVTAEAVTK